MSLTLYPRLLGPSWHELAAPVRRAHLDGASLRAVGSFRIRHGTNRFARFLARLLRLPSVTEAADAWLVVTPLGRGERWMRSFDGRLLTSTQWEGSGGRLIERIKLLELQFWLEVRAGALFYRQVGASLRFGPLRVPLPRWMAPRVEAREEPDGAGRMHVLVSVTVPRVGLLVSYEGHIERQEVLP